MGKDYYGILGVSRDAGPDQLKKAYRKLALKWHPDKHPDPEDKRKAEEHFKDVAEAYDVLSDPEKKKIYDQFGEEGLKGGTPMGGGMGGTRTFVYSGVDPSEIFSRFFGSHSAFDDMGFGGGFRSMSFVMGDDLFSGMHEPSVKKPQVFTVDLNLSLEDLYNGIRKRLKITRTRFDRGRRQQEEKFLEVDVKPGWKDGTKVTFAGEGDQNQPNAPPGDIVFVVKGKPHPKFTRSGNHLIYQANVSLRDALLGTRIQIDTLDKRRLTVEVPGVINPKTRKVISNEGMPISKAPGTKGDMIVEFNIQFPSHLTQDQRAAIIKYFP